MHTFLQLKKILKSFNNEIYLREYKKQKKLGK